MGTEQAWRREDLDMGTQFASSSPQKVYRTSLDISMKRVLQYAFYIATNGAFFLYMWFSNRFDLFTKIITTLIVLIVLLVFSWILYISIQAKRRHLITSPEGIAYSGTGYRLFTPWENVAGIGSRNGITILELHQPAPLFEVKTRSRVPADASTFVPISSVIMDWQDGALAEDMRHYAPHIFSSRGQGLVWTNDT